MSLPHINRNIPVFTCIFFFATLPWSGAYGCSCIGSASAADMMRGGNSVFEGVAVSRGREAGNFVYGMKVCNGKKTILVETPVEGSLCGHRFAMGKTVLFGAARWKGRYRTTICQKADMDRYRRELRRLVAKRKERDCE